MCLRNGCSFKGKPQYANFCGFHNPNKPPRRVSPGSVARQRSARRRRVPAQLLPPVIPRANASAVIDLREPESNFHRNSIAIRHASASTEKPPKGIPVDDCCICLEVLLDTEATNLSCGHIFHVECLKIWNQTAQSCPQCRASSRPLMGQTTKTMEELLFDNFLCLDAAIFQHLYPPVFAPDALF